MLGIVPIWYDKFSSWFAGVLKLLRHVCKFSIFPKSSNYMPSRALEYFSLFSWRPGCFVLKNSRIYSMLAKSFFILWWWLRHWLGFLVLIKSAKDLKTFQCLLDSFSVNLSWNLVKNAKYLAFSLSVQWPVLFLSDREQWQFWGGGLKEPWGNLDAKARVLGQYGTYF